MDPPSVTVSITAVLQLSTKVLACLNEIKDAPIDRTQCATEISKLCSLLYQLRYEIKKSDSTQPWYNAVQTLAVKDGPLDQFKQALEPLQTRMINESRWKQAEAPVWKFGKGEVASILDRTARLIMLAEVALRMDHSKLSQAIVDNNKFVPTHVPVVQSGEDKIRHDQDSKKHRMLLEWISSSNYPAQHSDILRRRQEGTGRWFLNAPEVAKWLSEAKATLFCPGIPGAGKTIIATIIIDYLLKSVQNSSVGVTYVYCNYKAYEEQHASSILAAILKQLVQARPSIVKSVERLYRQHADRRTRPSLEEVFGALQDVVIGYSTIYIVIDALDECQDGDGNRDQLLAKIRELQTGMDVRLLVTSRHVPEVTDKFRKALQLEIRASEDDIERFVLGQIVRFPAFIGRDLMLQTIIKEKVVEAADGMFHLARLHVNSIVGQRSRKAVMSTLARLTRGSEALDVVYEENMQIIERQPVVRRELAMNVLSWITFAIRPLTAAELCTALAVESDEAEFDPDNIPYADDLLSVCAGLVTVDHGIGAVCFAHYTMQDYFHRNKGHWFPDAEASITAICTAYLSLDIFSTGICQTDEDFAERLHAYCLYDYAARYWGHHARNSSAVSQKVIDFLQNKPRLEASSQAMLVDKKDSSSNYSQQFPKQITGLHLSAYFGLDKAAVTLLDSGHPPNCKDSNGQTPLWWSANRGYEAATKVLCEKDTATLHLLIQKGEGDLIKSLLKAGYNVNTADFRKRTPLHNAITSGSVELATDLVSAGADVNAKDMNEVTPLRLALSSKKLDLINMLLDKSASTMDITRIEWNRAFGTSDANILKLAEKPGGGISLEFIERQLQNKVAQMAAKSGTQRCLL